jgi:5-methylcytosine-specific restriction endonuclease McrA
MELTKICTKCPEGPAAKPQSAFYVDNSRYDRLSPYCKQCLKEKAAKPAQVAKRKAYKAAYHVQHAEKINARSIQWAKDHPEQFRARKSRWRATHKPQILAAAARYRAENLLLCRARARLSRMRKPAYYALRRKLWRVLNRNKVAEYQHKRRALEQNIPYVEEVDIAVLFVRDRGICSICHKRVRRFKDGSVQGSRDHIIPVTMPGSEHSYKNMALAHTWCNSRKGNRAVPQQMRLF